MPESKSPKIEVKYKTPSQSPFPVFVLCQPCFVSDDVENNVWMKNPENKKDAEPIDVEKFMAEWYNFYNLLAANSLVYLLPPTDGLQDQVYVNSFVYLPHVTKKDTIILSNFTAEGRAGEETVAGQFLKSMGYSCIKPPFKFEGFPELKWLRENIYFGGYGFRTDIRFHHWFEKNYDAKVIKIKEKDEFCYHLDCNLFVLDDQNVIACDEIIDKNTLKEIEKVANIFPVTDDDVYEDACNIVRVDGMLIAASSIQFIKKSDPLFEKQKHKNDRLEKICDEMGLELIIISLDEQAKSGAATSCLCTPLTPRTY
jgi:N-dimethylarginine dimethylaminohydrolase